MEVTFAVRNCLPKAPTENHMIFQIKLKMETDLMKDFRKEVEAVLMKIKRKTKSKDFKGATTQNKLEISSCVGKDRFRGHLSQS